MSVQQTERHTLQTDSMWEIARGQVVKADSLFRTLLASSGGEVNARSGQNFRLSKGVVLDLPAHTTRYEGPLGAVHDGVWQYSIVPTQAQIYKKRVVDFDFEATEEAFFEALLAAEKHGANPALDEDVQKLIGERQALQAQQAAADADPGAPLGPLDQARAATELAALLHDATRAQAHVTYMAALRA